MRTILHLRLKEFEGVIEEAGKEIQIKVTKLLNQKQKLEVLPV